MVLCFFVYVLSGGHGPKHNCHGSLGGITMIAMGWTSFQWYLANMTPIVFLGNGAGAIFLLVTTAFAKPFGA